MSMKRFILVLSLLTAGLSPAFAKEHIVKIISDYQNMQMIFEPKTILIQKGDTVTWVNQVDEDHDMVTYPDGYPKGAKGFSSSMLKKSGEKWSHTFTDKGTYEYHCIPHVMMGMRGSVIVEKPTESAFDMNKPNEAEVAAYRNRMLEFFDTDDFDSMPSYVAERLHPEKYKQQNLQKRIEPVKGGVKPQELKKPNEI